MSRAPWHLFQALQSRAHLLVGLMPERSFGNGEVKAKQNPLLRVLRIQKPSGRYSATVVRDVGRAELYFAFENKADADRLAAIVKAKATLRYPGWASQQAFDLQEAAFSAMEASLPPARGGGRTRTKELTVGWRMRRGARVPFKASE